MPTVGTLAVALGVSMAQLTNLANAQQSGWYGTRLTKDSVMVLEKELFMLECLFDANFENGSYSNPVTGIFAAKNLYGWRDTREVHQQTVTVEVTPEQIAARYQQAIPTHTDMNGEVHQLQDGLSARSAGRMSGKLLARAERGEFADYDPEG